MVVAMLMVQDAAAAPREAPPADADFLEFLGSWSTGDEKWVDPFQDDLPDLEQEMETRESLPRDSRDRHGIPRLKKNPTPRSPNPEIPDPPREGMTP